LPRPVVNAERVEPQVWQTTRVESDARGQRRLVNELRLNSSGRRP
jgi:hypothetical protein